ncbi:MAG: Fic/DOC family N-terminal domain-containing protein [Dehalococcoidales bacterium]|jgi:Fic family protein|nr:Fic/DOC family N-terminal domain-containing protein [Dehalococcoidales bacterium]
MKPCIPDTLPIKAVNWEPLIPLIGKSNRELAYFNGILYGINNPDVLLSPLTTQEAVLSSRIEGTQATLGEVLKFEAGETPETESRRNDIDEIINYRQAMRMAENELQTRPFNLNLLKKLHRILLAGVRGSNKSRGEFRTTQNLIGLPGATLDNANFVPPIPQLLPEYLNNWEKYWHLDRPDPLVQLAVIHAQFEILHPFLDGNGRLGRMVIPLFLYEKKILSRPEFYISGYLEEHVDEYVQRLHAICIEPDGWDNWIAFFLITLSEQARANSIKAQAIIQLYERLKRQVIDTTHSQFAVMLLDQMFKQPIFPSNIFNTIPGMPTQTAVLTMLNKLKSEKILKVISPSSGRRSQVLVLTELINICEGKEVF